MFKVALTGNVASGKSAVAGFWSNALVPVLLADELARQVVAPGTPGLEEVIQAFGEDYLRGDGSLDREKLRELVFQNPEDRARLEEILHPNIKALRDEWIARHEKRRTALVVAEIPLLFEAGMEEDFDAVVLVFAPEEECLRRLMENRGLSRETALRMMESQIPPEEKLPRVDFLLENGGTLDDLEIRSQALLDLLRARARQRGDL